MSRNRVLYHPDAVRRLFEQMRADLSAQHFRHMCQQADLRKQLEQCRAELDELRDAVLKRQHAEAELASLYRQRTLTTAWTAPRDPNAALN